MVEFNPSPHSLESADTCFTLPRKDAKTTFDFVIFSRFKWEESLTPPTPRNLSLVVVSTSGTLVRPPEAGILIIVLGKMADILITGRRSKIFCPEIKHRFFFLASGTEAQQVLVCRLLQSAH